MRFLSNLDNCSEQILVQEFDGGEPSDAGPCRNGQWLFYLKVKDFNWTKRGILDCSTLRAKSIYKTNRHVYRTNKSRIYLLWVKQKKAAETLQNERCSGKIEFSHKWENLKKFEKLLAQARREKKTTEHDVNFLWNRKTDAKQSLVNAVVVCRSRFVS